jgi:hypothetical protein
MTPAAEDAQVEIVPEETKVEPKKPRAKREKSN